jgi:murein DD-endopeptidase MepM/ murein hydrolase activator NlpD
MPGKKYINFLIYPDDHKGVRFKITKNFFFFLVGLFGLFVLGSILVTIFYSNLSYNTFLAHSLKSENRKLKEYNAKVIELEKELDQYRDFVKKVMELAGLEGVEYPQNKVDLASISSDVDTLKKDSKRVVSFDPEKNKTRVDANIPKGMPLNGWVTKGFETSSLGLGGEHSGIDIACEEKTPVKATAKGKVKFAGWDKLYGYLIVIDHSGGIETYYGHNSKLLAKKGEMVIKGQTIALSGNTGQSSAPHLHYEIRKDEVSINPQDYIK